MEGEVVRIKLKERNKPARSRFFWVSSKFSLEENVTMMKNRLEIDNLRNVFPCSEDGTPYEDISFFKHDDIVYLDDEDQEIRKMVSDYKRLNVKSEENKCQIEEIPSEKYTVKTQQGQLLLESDSWEEICSFLDKHPATKEFSLVVYRPPSKRKHRVKVRIFGRYNKYDDEYRI
eukprot:TRINITY_DN8316_c0_g1_i1.p1 TRINITY_DN8316_c0_g1~~TRINITY_DN8316_c0_g1_i1.p1  ORF type:complete len:174 (+),score=35.12 TRINITY_DN8316_c0_g1_i1:15-536(+)